LDEIKEDRRHCMTGSAQLDTSRLDTSHSQRSNSGKPLDTGRVIGGG